jgi:hypothetical protein
MVMRGPLRQSQVIRPFGPGAMHTDRFRNLPYLLWT